MRVRVLFDPAIIDYLPEEDMFKLECGDVVLNDYFNTSLRQEITTDGDIHKQLEINNVDGYQLARLQELKSAGKIVELFISETDSELPVNNQGKSFNEYVRDEDYVRDDGV